MPAQMELSEILNRTETYLIQTLLPFWMTRAPDPDYGGVLSHFDRDGNATGETVKPFLMQIRALYTWSSAHRAGYGEGKCAELAKASADFLINHYWDSEYEGWIWIADRSGNPTFCGKIGYGQCFGVYAFSEYFLATGDERGREAADRTYAANCKYMLDSRHGGYWEIFGPDWQPERPGIFGGDRKSMDVHMHMMEALTSFYEMTKNPAHQRRLREVIDLIIGRMLDPKFGTGYIQFAGDFTPLPAILFQTPWGRDAKPSDGLARPLDLTSYGHNVEFAWLLLHAADILGQPRDTYREVVRKIFDHAVNFGIDWEYGGVFTEGPQDGPTDLTEKQFWQQAEVLVGLLDAYDMLGDERYWQAFRKVYDFVFEKFVSPAGEWYERLNRHGRPIDDALGHAWKINYHTVRSMVQTVRRLKKLISQGASR